VSDRNKLLFATERWIREIWQERDIQAVDRLHHPDFIDRSPSGRGSDNPSYKEGLAEFFEAFPDFFTQISDTVVDVDHRKVAIRWRATGTHEAEFLNIQPTGRFVHFVGIEILTIDEDGLITERWGEWDGLSILHQLTA